MPSLLVDVPADAYLLARALGGRSALVAAWVQAGKAAYVACDPVEVSSELDPEPALPLAPCPDGRSPRWFGLLPYEARRSLERGSAIDRRPAPSLRRPLWRRYGAVIEITNKVQIIGDNSLAIDELLEKLRAGLRQGPRVEPIRLELKAHTEPAAEHARRIERALELIARGEIYQVNLARRFELEARGRCIDLLAALTEERGGPFSAAFEWPELGVVAASPELFLALDADGTARTSPIKGTRPRHSDAARDRALAAELDADPKERAELAMVIDVERNDLGRLARPGGVRLLEPPRVESYATVHHRVATVQAELRPGVSRGEVLEALLPSGSVTGAPKIRAMELIAALEPARRGLYTGAFGVLRHDGGLELGMAIRVLTIRDGIGEYFSGGGIVADSNPEREIEETLWKAAALVRQAGGNAENWA